MPKMLVSHILAGLHVGKRDMSIVADIEHNTYNCLMKYSYDVLSLAVF